MSQVVGLAAAIVLVAPAARADELLRTTDELANDIITGAFSKEASEGAALINEEDEQWIEAGGGLIPGTSVRNDDIKSSCGTTSQCLDDVAKIAKEMPNIQLPDFSK